MSEAEGRARQADVVVIGGGIAGLTLAHDLAREGVGVLLCEASDRFGGLLRRGLVAGCRIDLGAESFALRNDAVARLIFDAALPVDLVEPQAGGAFLAFTAAPESGSGLRRAPLPRRTVLGIPAEPLADDVVEIIGRAAAERVAQEPAQGTFAGEEPTLFALVSERCGRVLAERLVDTLCRSVYSRPATEVKLSQLHPSFWRAFLAHGSLVAAAGEVAPRTRAGSAVAGIDGGMWQLATTLAEAAERAGAMLHANTTVARIDGDAESGFVVHTGGGAVQAQRVIIATGPVAAARLLGRPASEAETAAASAPIRVVAAAIDSAPLDAAPVGTGVIVAPSAPTAAKALTHVTAKWAWAARVAGAGCHLIRLSVRDPREHDILTATDVAREVSALTGVEIDARQVREVAVQDWHDAVAAGGAAAGMTPLPPGLYLAGAAAAGAGLAAVIPHARELAREITHDLSAHSSRSIA